MFRLWFKLELGGREFYVDCESIELARRVYDSAVKEAGWVPLQVRP